MLKSDLWLAEQWLQQKLGQGLERRHVVRPPIFRAVVALLVVGNLCSNPALACSFVDGSLAMRESVTSSSFYWLVSCVIGGAIVCVDYYQGRWPLISAIAVVLLVFHPAWTVAPLHGPDCSFQNVEPSQLVLAVICLLLVYQIFRIVRSRRRPGSAVRELD